MGRGLAIRKRPNDGVSIAGVAVGMCVLWFCGEFGVECGVVGGGGGGGGGGGVGGVGGVGGT